MNNLDMAGRMMMLAVQLGLILFVARIACMLFERLRLPGIMGEVVAGIIIGPYALGAIAIYGFPAGLFPSGDGFPVSPELYGLCAIAAVVLLFTVGLETDMRLLKRYSLAGVLVGVGGVVVSFIFGDLVTMAFSHMVFGRTLGFMAPECLFLGVVSTATSVGITARILSERKKLGSPEGVTIIAGAVIDDVLGVILLAIVLGVISASQSTGSIDWRHIGMIAGKAVGIWLVAMLLGLAASRRLSFLLKLFRDRSEIALMALGLALVLAGLFEHAGLAMIVGAYVVGLSLSQTDITYVIREKLEPVYKFLVPVFFCVMGMLIDLHSLVSPKVLIFGAAYTGVAILTKVIGCGLPTMLAGFNFRGAMRIGVGMVPRCEIALTIASIALARGAVSGDVLGIPVMLVMATTLLSPLLLSALFRSDAPGTSRDTENPDEKIVSFTFPSKEISGLLRSKLLSVFESEGFFIHQIDKIRQVYHLRKDDMAIELRSSNSDIIFSCHAGEVSLVNAAMYEVTAELEQTIAGLRQPVDRRQIARRMMEDSSEGSDEKRLASFLNQTTLEPNLKGDTKEEIIDELLAMLDGQGVINDLDQARTKVWERENSMSTGLQHGIAIPHGRTDSVKRLVCAVGLKRKGVEFDCLDGLPATIIVLTLSPESGSSPHMQFMSMISHALSESGRETLLTCRTAREMYSVLTV